MDIETRLAKLERSLRRWKLAAAAVAVVAIGSAAGDGKPEVHDVLVARDIRIVNSVNNPVGRFWSMKVPVDGTECGVLSVASSDLKKQSIITPGSPLDVVKE